MNPEEQAAEYAADQFMEIGVVASAKEILAAMHFVDKFYMEVWEPTPDECISVIEYTEEEKRKFIQEEMPGIPHTVIQGVLDAEQRFFGRVANE